MRVAPAPHRRSGGLLVLGQSYRGGGAVGLDDHGGGAEAAIAAPVEPGLSFTEGALRGKAGTAAAVALDAIDDEECHAGILLLLLMPLARIIGGDGRPCFRRAAPLHHE